MRRNKVAFFAAYLTVVLVFLGLTTAQEAKKITCAGKVVDAKSQPVEGAKVALYVYSRGTNSFSYGTSPTEQVTTRSDGTFSLSVLGDGENYTYGYVVAQKKGLALGWASWNMRAGSMELEIKLDRPNTLAGTVVDENGKPVSEAQVSIYMLLKAKQYLTSPVAPMLLSANTDPMGNFAFSNLPAETLADFVFRKTGRATINTQTDSPRLTYAVGQTDIKLVLPAESRIEGVVAEKETGKPVAGAKLVIKDGNRWIQEPFDSKDSGAFSIGSLAPGKYKLELLAPGEGLADWVAKPVEAVLESGKTATGVRIELVKGGVFEIVVTDAITGKPLENAYVTVLHKLGSQAGYGRTGKDGILRIRLMPGDFFLLDGISKQGYSPQGVEEPFTIVDGKTESREYAIFPDSALRGVVRDEKGKPLEGATLIVWPSERQQEAVANAEGKFVVTYEMQNLSNDETPTLLLCRHKGSNLATALEIGESVRTLDVTLKPGITLTGSVVDPDGKGIEGARLRIELCKPGLSWPIVPINPTRDEATTNKEGKFEIRAIPAGQKYCLSVEAKGYGNKRTDEINTSDAAGSQFSLRNITLAVANLSVSGIVVDEGGKPVAGVTVNTYTADQPYHLTKTDTDGKFTFEGVCAGRILILASKLGTKLHGSIYADGGATDAKIVISQKPLRLGYQQKQPPSLVGKPLPDLKKFGVSPPLADIAGNIAIICFFDMNQRPSRNCIQQLSKRAQELMAKDVVVLAVQASKVDQSKLNEWVKANDVPFPVGMVKGDEEQTRFAWGVKSLPWLILTDKKHIVCAEGFAVSELEQRISGFGSDLSR